MHKRVEKVKFYTGEIFVYRLTLVLETARNK